MLVTILGGGGFLGRRLARQLMRDGALGGRAISGLTLFDVQAPVDVQAPGRLPAPFPVSTLAGDINDADALAIAIPEGTAVIFHLAAVVSAAAEADFDLGLQVNLHGTLAVLEACRALSVPPRLVFTSSVASFGGGQAALVPDDGRQLPGNSYGTQKAIGELLLQDASRRGLLDAVSIRLPSVTIRPGRPNQTASSFVSAILREPLLGLETPCPVPEDFALWICSPRRAVDWLLHAAVLDTAPLGLDRGINPPGASVTVREMLAALPDAARALVRMVPDAAIQAILGNWPAGFAATRARQLGFAEQETLPEVVRAFVEDDLAGTRAERRI